MSARFSARIRRNTRLVSERGGPRRTEPEGPLREHRGAFVRRERECGTEENRPSGSELRHRRPSGRGGKFVARKVKERSARSGGLRSGASGWAAGVFAFVEGLARVGQIGLASRALDRATAASRRSRLSPGRYTNLNRGERARGSRAAVASPLAESALGRVRVPGLEYSYPPAEKQFGGNKGPTWLARITSTQGDNGRARKCHKMALCVWRTRRPVGAYTMVYCLSSRRPGCPSAFVESKLGAARCGATGGAHARCPPGTMGARLSMAGRSREGTFGGKGGSHTRRATRGEAAARSFLSSGKAARPLSAQEYRYFRESGRAESSSRVGAGGGHGSHGGSRARGAEALARRPRRPRRPRRSDRRPQVGPPRRAVRDITAGRMPRAGIVAGGRAASPHLRPLHHRGLLRARGNGKASWPPLGSGSPPRSRPAPLGGAPASRAGRWRVGDGRVGARGARPNARRGSDRRAPAGRVAIEHSSTSREEMRGEQWAEATGSRRCVIPGV
ncbi:hypothetical protein KM043_000582 [Ampulex compressa]|nr:hypothetical protein KM043_000582 [Ampulex compressa]